MKEVANSHAFVKDLVSVIVLKRSLVIEKERINS